MHPSICVEAVEKLGASRRLRRLRCHAHAAIRPGGRGPPRPPRRGRPGPFCGLFSGAQTRGARALVAAAWSRCSGGRAAALPAPSARGGSLTALLRCPVATSWLLSGKGTVSRSSGVRTHRLWQETPPRATRRDPRHDHHPTPLPPHATPPPPCPPSTPIHTHTTTTTAACARTRLVFGHRPDPRCRARAPWACVSLGRGGTPRHTPAPVLCPRVHTGAGRGWRPPFPTLSSCLYRCAERGATKPERRAKSVPPAQRVGGQQAHEAKQGRPSGPCGCQRRARMKLLRTAKGGRRCFHTAPRRRARATPTHHTCATCAHVVPASAWQRGCCWVAAAFGTHINLRMGRARAAVQAPRARHTARGRPRCGLPSQRRMPVPRAWRGAGPWADIAACGCGWRAGCRVLASHMFTLEKEYSKKSKNNGG